MRILIYDVETAQSKNVGTICAVGWMLLENDQITDEGYSLINPHCSFSHTNIEIHGITADDVEDAPSFAEYWESTLKVLMTSSLVIAHNANFDLSATEQALFIAGVNDPGIFYLDTLPVFRTLVDAPSYKLMDLATLIDYKYNAHNASEDVHALYHVLCHIRDLYGFEDIAAMLLRTPVRAENTKTNAFVPREISYTAHFPTYTHCTEEVQIVDGCLHGLKVCITGDVANYERSDIERMILEHGGKPSSGVSGRTDFLIVGTYIDPSSGLPAMTSKHKKALELIEQGGKIRILSFDDFLEILKSSENE